MQVGGTVEASPHGPWTVVTFRHLFVKVNDAYMWFIAQSHPHSLHLITFAGKFAECTIDRKQCLDFRQFVALI